MKNLYLECDCYSPEHRIVFKYDTEETMNGEYGWLVVETHLNPDHGIWRRIWQAIKYVFKRPCRYGHFSSIDLSKSQINNLVDMLKVVQEAMNK